jgi:short-subunit dehydrogenase
MGASFEVNMLAHIRAASQWVAGWLERGAGRFVVTASAAGLLTMLGSPTYRNQHEQRGQPPK